MRNRKLFWLIFATVLTLFAARDALDYVVRAAFGH
jgi:hypothetical protein